MAVSVETVTTECEKRLSAARESQSFGVFYLVNVGDEYRHGIDAT